MNKWIPLILLMIISCKDGKKYHDAKPDFSQEPQLIQEVLNWQLKKNEEFKNPKTSPLIDKDRKDFEGLDFFVVDTTFRVLATLERTPQADMFLMPTTTDRMAKEKVYGLVHFALQGKSFTLEVYQSPDIVEEEGYEDYLFLPFLDNTNGKETYGGGRYLDLRVPSGNKIIIDFNKAYNPLCAYNKKYSCPIVPAQNKVGVAIKAGVKAYTK